MQDTLTISTRRLDLIPLTGADAEDLHRISNEPDVRRYLWDDAPVAPETIRDVVVQSAAMFAERGIGLFGVRRRGNEDLLGFCGFVLMPGMDEPELGYELTRGAWGKGLATEASRACLRHAFEEAKLERVIAGADAPNAASLRVMEKLGMQPAGNLNPGTPETPYFVIYREDFLASENEG